MLDSTADSEQNGGLERCDGVISSIDGYGRGHTLRERSPLGGVSSPLRHATLELEARRTTFLELMTGCTDPSIEEAVSEVRRRRPSGTGTGPGTHRGHSPCTGRALRRIVSRTLLFL